MEDRENAEQREWRPVSAGFLTAGIVGFILMTYIIALLSTAASYAAEPYYIPDGSMVITAENDRPLDGLRP